MCLIIHIDDILIIADTNFSLLGFITPRANPIHTILGLFGEQPEHEISLPEDKIRKIVREAHLILRCNRVSAQQLARLVGLLSACSDSLASNEKQASSTGWLRTFNTRSQNGCASTSKPTTGKPIKRPQPDLVIHTDASLLGWGATSQGARGTIITHQCPGTHGGMVCMPSLFPGKIQPHGPHLVLIWMDNTSAIAYININHMGGIPT